MKVKTTQHFKKLIDIIKEDGFLTALDYDYQITRAKDPFLNWFLEDVEYLKAPIVSWYGDKEREHTYKYYTAKYVGGFGREKLADLKLK